MSTRPRTIAILAANPALTALLRVTLESENGFRMAAFETVEALTIFTRITPVDLIVVDADTEALGSDAAVRELRAQERSANPGMGLIVLTRAEPAFHGRFLVAGADAVLAKPVVPGRLVLAVARLLGEEAMPMHQVGGMRAGREGPPRCASPSPGTGSNVIPLFGPNSPRR
ncbi:response regulator [Devosia sp. PTR5]|uniref:Response regulator n=1 Tax=Devosia oryzisoli TaxID=2774138 RepID=A0A927FY48_9HYPH|nr:response regulator [Devosia oryzisoli]MBD8066774.1 response regulator [Devosia oryzisoli]